MSAMKCACLNSPLVCFASHNLNHAFLHDPEFVSIMIPHKMTVLHFNHASTQNHQFTIHSCFTHDHHFTFQSCFHTWPPFYTSILLPHMITILYFNHASIHDNHFMFPLFPLIITILCRKHASIHDHYFTFQSCFHTWSSILCFIRPSTYGHQFTNLSFQYSHTMSLSRWHSIDAHFTFALLFNLHLDIGDHLYMNVDVCKDKIIFEI